MPFFRARRLTPWSTCTPPAGGNGAHATPAGAMPPPGLCRDGWHWPAPRGRSLAIAEPFPALMAWVALTNIGKCHPCHERGKGFSDCQGSPSRCWPVPPITTKPRRRHGPCGRSVCPIASCGRGAGAPRCQPSRSEKRHSGLPEKSDVSRSSIDHFFLTGETVRV